MPLYEYECRNCKYNFEVRESIFSENQTLCLECNTESLFRVVSCNLFSIKGEVKTIAQLADKNWKKMGIYERESRMESDKIPEVVAKRERKAKIDKISNMTVEQKNKYIMEGD